MKVFSSVNKKTIIGACALAGNIIGAGILGLPYAFAQAGFLIGLFWLIFLGTILLYLFLCLGEVALRTKEKLQLLGYAEKYVGKKSFLLMSFALLFGLYAALLAFLIGEGQSISYLLTSTTNYATYFTIGFWIIMSLLLREGLRSLKKISTLGVFAVIIIIIIIFAVYAPQLQYENIKNIQVKNFFLPFGIVLFALLGFNAIPELEMIMKGNEKKFKRAIIIGVLIPIVLYAIFSFSIVGALGKNSQQIASIGLAKIITILGIFTMATAYFVSSFCLKDLYRLDYKCSKRKTIALVVFLPIVLYMILSLIQKFSFTQVLGIGGVISGGITAIIILIMHANAKKYGNRKPEYEVLSHPIIILLLSIIFIAGIIVQLLW